MSKFKVGDKVIMPKIIEIGHATKGFIESSGTPINNPIVVTSVGFYGSYECITTSYYNGYIPVGCFELFIEPEFKVGFKFNRPVISSSVRTEIVKVSLNKKRKKYFYVCFDLDDGYPSLFDYDYIKECIKKYTPKKVCPITKPVEEMTLAQVCRKLGKDIKIVK